MENIALYGNEGTEVSSSERYSSTPHIAIFFRAIKLQIVNYLCRWRKPIENQKVAIHRNHSVAFIRSLLHLTPTAVSLFLIIYNVQANLVPYSSWYSAIQFAAKIQEMLIQASITAILLAYIRHNMSQEQSAPFGALFAAVEVSNLSYLWSLEFVGALTAQYYSSWKKTKLASMVIFSILLAASVGPSSAILMLPRPTRSLDSSSTWNLGLDESELFPNNLTTPQNNTVDMNFLAQLAKHRTTARPFQYGDVSKLDTKYLTTTCGRLNLVQYNTSFVDFLSSMSMPMLLYSDMSMSIPSSEQFAWSPGIETPNSVSTVFEGKIPSTAVYCYPGQPIDGTRNSSYVYFHPPRNTTLGNIMTEGDFLDAYAASNASIIWLSPPEGYREQLSLLAVAGIRENGNSSDGKNSITPFTCVIKASWVDSKINTTWNGRNRISLNPTLIGHGQPENPSRRDCENNAFFWPETTVQIDPQWMEAIRDSSNSIHTSLSLKAVMDYVEDISRGTKLQFYPSTLSQVLAGTISTSMAAQRCNYSCLLSTPKLRTGFDTDYPVTFKVDVYLSGIGYSLNNWTTILATCILICYCAYALAFVLHSCMSGVSSNSWDSAAEITALALNSKPPKHLGPITAGIETLAVFREPVAIEDSIDGGLELRFRGRKDVSEGFQPIQKNKRY